MNLTGSQKREDSCGHPLIQEAGCGMGRNKSLASRHPVLGSQSLTSR